MQNVQPPPARYGPTRIPPEVRFWAKVDKTGDCWLWIASTPVRGYGTFRLVRGKFVLAHRYSWELANGLVPDGLIVCHRCDVRNCVNPGHLFLGTYRDNTRDMMAKNRQGWDKPEAIAARKQRTADALAMAADRGHPHGTVNGYNTFKCRDICCKEAKTEWLRRRTAARAS